MRIELTTARLRIGCSTTELRWRRTKPTPVERVGAHALERTRTATPFGTTPSRWRVYQFHHQGLTTTGLTGLEPATSGVTDRHSNQLSYSPMTCILPSLPRPREARTATGFVCPGSPTGGDGARRAPIAPTGVEPVSPP